MPRQVDLDMIELIDNKLTVDEYLKLRALVGWKKLSREQAQKALDNSLLVVGAYLAGQPIGMGRLVGDGCSHLLRAGSCHSAAGARYGIGSLVLSRLTQYVESLRLPGTEMMFDLMCAKGRERFYEAHGFLARPTEKIRTRNDPIYERQQGIKVKESSCIAAEQFVVIVRTIISKGMIHCGFILARYCVGVRPYSCLKTFMKFSEQLYPSCSAIIFTGVSAYKR